MNDIDDKIRAALRHEESFRFEGDDQSMFQMMADSFRGKNRWLIVLVWFYTLAFFAVAILCAVRAFHTIGDQRVLWSAGFIFAMMAVGQLKSWYLMQINRNSILREIKRLELRVVKLAEDMSPS